MPEIEAAHQAFLNDRASGTVELGPRSLALLRRMLLCLEKLADMRTADPGKQFEDDAAQWPQV